MYGARFSFESWNKIRLITWLASLLSYHYFWRRESCSLQNFRIFGNVSNGSWPLFLEKSLFYRFLRTHWYSCVFAPFRGQIQPQYKGILDKVNYALGLKLKQWSWNRLRSGQIDKNGLLCTQTTELNKNTRAPKLWNLQKGIVLAHLTGNPDKPNIGEPPSKLQNNICQPTLISRILLILIWHAFTTYEAKFHIVPQYFTVPSHCYSDFNLCSVQNGGNGWIIFGHCAKVSLHLN